MGRSDLRLPTRADFYQPGLPARAGEHYKALVRFACRHAGHSILDLGCGFGAYSAALRAEGLACVGCDVDLGYLRSAASQGLTVAAVDSVLPFKDRSFDSVLLFEVIEHVSNLDNLLQEAFRVARKNVLLTVPNSEDIDLMKSNDVTYAHMLSVDHVHFFDRKSLRSLLRMYSNDVLVERDDPILPFWFVGRSLPFYLMKCVYRVGLIKPRFFSRLYAVASVRQD